MLIFDPDADLLILDPLADDWLVLVIGSVGATGTLKGCVSIEATVQGAVEIGPVWTGQLVISPTFSGAVEICE